MTDGSADLRKNVERFFVYFLSHKGNTIKSIEANRNEKLQGDKAQRAFRNEHVWHTRTEIIPKIAKALYIREEYFGRNRRNNKFEKIVQQIIDRYHKKGMLRHWSAKNHYGVFRLEPEHCSDDRPVLSMEIDPNVTNPAERDMMSRFLWIISKSSKNGTYKFAFARALLEYCAKAEYGKYEISYDFLAEKFLSYYWHQECKFRMRQGFRDDAPLGVIRVIRRAFPDDKYRKYSDIPEKEKAKAIGLIRRSVFGTAKSQTSIVLHAFQSLDGMFMEDKMFYDYDDDMGIVQIKPEAFRFFRENHRALLKAVFWEWVRFLERINNSLPMLAAKIERFIQERGSISSFRQQYLNEGFGCFYCGCELDEKNIEVDHFLPWSYIFEDEGWNLVPSCMTCNRKKSDRIPEDKFVTALLQRNHTWKDTKLMGKSLDRINGKDGWESEINNHYNRCKEYGFVSVKMP